MNTRGPCRFTDIDGHARDVAEEVHVVGVWNGPGRVGAGG